MRTLILGMLAETHVHPGAGQREGAVDLPVARERTTDYPFVPGSGVKGAVRERAEERAKGAAGARCDAGTREMFEAMCRAIAPERVRASEFHPWFRRKFAPIEKIEDRRRRLAAMASMAVSLLYGEAETAGSLIFTDARLLLLPVRSLSRAYFWLTCPYLLERFRRDLRRAGVGIEIPVPEAPPQRGTILCAGSADERIFLEERLFARMGDVPDGLARALTPLFGDSEARERLSDQLALVSDGDFAWFARYALPVHARNVLHDDTKASVNLWYEESLAPDTLLYTLILCRDGEAAQHIRSLFFEGEDARPYLQLGGNETVGQGWFHLAEVTA